LRVTLPNLRVPSEIPQNPTILVVCPQFSLLRLTLRVLF
jgi:hypothetical protein